MSGQIIGARLILSNYQYFNHYFNQTSYIYLINMSGEKIIFLGLVISLTLSQNCPKYVCSNEVSESCVIFTDNTYTVSSCDPSTPYCPPLVANSPGNIVSTCTTANSYPSQKYPGEICSSSSECYSNTCYKGVCQGKSFGDVCNSPFGYSDNVDCGPGLFCDFSQTPSTCGYLKHQYSGCEIDTECQYGLGCYSGICLKYRSISKGDQIISLYCVNFQSSFCEYEQCYSFNNGTAVCIGLLESVAEAPTMCTSNSGCLSKTDEVLGFPVQGTCECGYNPFGTSYCNTFAGEGYGNKFLKLLEDWENNDDIQNCNIDIAYTYTCINDY